MADYKKVSELDPITTVAGSDLVEIQQDQGGGVFVSKRTTVSVLAPPQFSIENPLGIENGDTARVFVPMGYTISHVDIFPYWGSTTFAFSWDGHSFSGTGNTTVDISTTPISFPQSIVFGAQSGVYGICVRFR